MIKIKQKKFNDWEEKSNFLCFEKTHGPKINSIFFDWLSVAIIIKINAQRKYVDKNVKINQFFNYHTSDEKSENEILLSIQQNLWIWNKRNVSVKQIFDFELKEITQG